MRNAKTFTKTAKGSFPINSTLYLSNTNCIIHGIKEEHELKIVGLWGKHKRKGNGLNYILFRKWESTKY